MDQHVRHAEAMAGAVVAHAATGDSGPGPTRPPGGDQVRFADLGAGGGVPALVLLDRWPGAQAVLIEAGVRRAEFLRQSVTQLGWEDRVRVLEERAEVSGRREDLRGSLLLVTARSFARPGVTAECAAPLLAPGGLLVVSEPPEESDRWPEEGLSQLGMRSGGRRQEDGFHFQLIEQAERCPDRYPRRTGVPERRPLF